MFELFDSHAHLTDPGLYQDLDLIMQRAVKTKVNKIINVCTDTASLAKALAARKKYPQIYLAAAATPHDVDKWGDHFLKQVEKAAENNYLTAIGETGLDYYYQHSQKETQKKHLLNYAALAQKHNLPLIFHVRDAFSDFFKLLENFSLKGVMHCFTGSLEDAEKALEKGFLISFSGIITFKKSHELQTIAAQIPLEKILIETDAPYLAPQSKRGKKNEPAFLLETAQKIAEIKNLSLEEVAYQTTQNATIFFKLPHYESEKF